MNKFPIKCIFLLLFIKLFINANEDQCPNKCTCKRSTQRDGTDYIKLKCGETEKISNLDEIDLLNIASEIVQFNLSDNQLTTFYPKVQLIALQKLDLSRNQLTELQNNQFSEFPHLRRLDISDNNIKNVELSAFANLEDLERLKLNQNQISSIALGTFDPLINLKQLDISNNPLTCDCGLLWLIDWSQKQSVKLVSNPKCNSPTTFKGLPLRKLKIGIDIHCKSPAGKNGLELIEMIPNNDQIVFEDDSLTLQCRAPNIFDAPNDNVIEWFWSNYFNVKKQFPEIVIENSFLNGLIESKLKISKIKSNYTGLWNCTFNSINGNYSTSIKIIVITNKTKFCPLITTKNNKGTYNWPQTIINHTVTIQCESINLNYDISMQKASYVCNENGKWINLNTTICSYVSETTKILEQFSKVNSSIIESVKHFRNYTSNLKHFHDKMDLVFTVNTIMNYLNYLTIDQQIGGILIDITNNLLDLSKKYLKLANDEFRICEKLVNTTEILAGITSSSLLHKSNIALELFPLKKTSFMGLKCTWYNDFEHKTDRLFYCMTNSHLETTEFNGKIPEASITIPETLFYQIEEQNSIELKNKVYNLLITMYSNNKFFPLNGSLRGNVDEDVTSIVVGTKLVDLNVNNLTDPVFITLKLPTSPIGVIYENEQFTPVWWNKNLQNGSGDWSTDGCQISNELNDYITFFCYNFGYYGLLQDITLLKTIQLNNNNNNLIKLSHPAIYVGSFILFISFLLTISTYLFCYNSIQMPKKSKHILINIWLTILFLCLIYIFGIYQIQNQRFCQIIGMLLHYFTLSSLLWICVGVNCLYKRLIKNDNNNIIQLQDDDLLNNEQPIKKPIIGLYFVGWGIAMIICGITAAINIKEYSSTTYCFLKNGPPLSALYIPFTILLIFLLIFFLLIRCTISNLDNTNGHLSEGTQATENVDLDLLDEPQINELNRSINNSNSTKTITSEILEDCEHSPTAQLKSFIIFLIIYILTWLTCAFSTLNQPFNFLITYENDLFSIAYAILATMLSSFTLFFYCVARNDVRTQWLLFSRWLKRKHLICLRTRSISDTNLPQIQQLNTTTINDNIQLNSRSNSRSSNSRTKSNNSNCSSNNILKTVAAIDLNSINFNETATTTTTKRNGTKVNNVNLIVLHRQQYRTNTIPNIIENPTNAAQVFYNPHQSTVARKFFKRQKRNMMKRNNLTTKLTTTTNSNNNGNKILTSRNCDFLNSDTTSIFSEVKQLKDNSSIDHSIYGTNSKVNNTNIHVEQIRKIKQRNLNLFSDDDDDDDNGGIRHRNIVPVERLVLNAERLRNRELLKHKKHSFDDNNMRSVSQQCTLEYSSENISDSILDKISPDDKLDNDDDDDKEIVSKVVDTKMNYNPPSEVGSSLLDSSLLNMGTVPKIYINPSHDLFHQHHNSNKLIDTNSSCVSVSDLDELYQQIRHGPIIKSKRHNNSSFNNRHNSPCLSDSEIHSYVGDIKYKQRASRSNDNLSENVETTV